MIFVMVMAHFLALVAEGGEWLCSAFTVGIQTVVIAAIAARADQIAHTGEPVARHTDALAVQVFVPAARALHFLFFEHADSLPAIHWQAGRWIVKIR
jgi:hypothetical protein